MNSTLTKYNVLGAAPWKFLLLTATLLFSYALPAHADDHAEPAAVEAEAGPVDDYNALLEAQGEYAHSAGDTERVPPTEDVLHLDDTSVDRIRHPFTYVTDCAAELLQAETHQVIAMMASSIL